MPTPPGSLWLGSFLDHWLALDAAPVRHMSMAE
jgi:hypothetical protein